MIRERRILAFYAKVHFQDSHPLPQAHPPDLGGHTHADHFRFLPPRSDLVASVWSCRHWLARRMRCLACFGAAMNTTIDRDVTARRSQMPNTGSLGSV